MRYILFIALALCAAACSSPQLGADFDQGWRYADSLQTTLAVHDTNRAHRLVIRTTIAEHYPYANLHLKLVWQTPDGRQRRYTPEFLFRNNQGEWLGGSGWGSSRSFEFVLADSLLLRPAGQHKLRLVQYMRADTLQGIEAVRLTLEPR